MRKMWKTIGVGFVAVSFMVAAIYCCCFNTSSLAKQKSACCKAKHSEKSKADHKQDCPHCNAAFNAETTAYSIEHSFASSPTVVADALVSKQSFVPVVLGVSLFNSGPPGYPKNLPLFILHHNFRL